jgi:hypothetical protein
MRRSALFALAIAANLPSLSAHAATPATACRVVGQTYDSKEVQCLLPRAEPAGRHEFVARFSGGHDDTQASIVTSLDQQPLACEAGSKKELLGEDGNVTLFCRFSVGAGVGADGVFKATIRWSHAEYTDYQLLDR